MRDPVGAEGWRRGRAVLTKCFLHCSVMRRIGKNIKFLNLEFNVRLTHFILPFMYSNKTLRFS